jgi:hypothetical protein
MRQESTLMKARAPAQKLSEKTPSRIARTSMPMKRTVRIPVAIFSDIIYLEKCFSV